MRYHENDSLFHYTWNQVAQALFQRYPNPDSLHVLSEDTLSRRIEDGKLLSTRLLVKTNRLPKWGERIVKARKVHVIEHSRVDPVNRVLETYTTNVGLTKFMSCIERVTYTCNPDDPTNSTMASRKTWIDSKIFGLGYAIQKFGIDRYVKNIERTDRGLVTVLARLFPRPEKQSSSVYSGMDARHKFLDTAQRAKLLLAEEKSRRMSAAACAESNA